MINEAAWPLVPVLSLNEYRGKTLSVGRDIVVLGSLNVDFVVRVSERPGMGQTVFGKEFSIFPGGKGANQAVAVGRLGGNVCMAGRIGDDVFSSILLESLTNANVGTDNVLITENIFTGSAFITVDDSGENSIIVIPGANSQYSKEDVDDLATCLKDAKTLMLQLEIPVESVEYAAQVAKSFGVTVMLDPAPAMSLPPELYRLIDVITPNEHEASLLTGIQVQDLSSAESAGLRLLEQGVHSAVVKLGAQGAFYCSSTGDRGYVKGHRVNVVDTTAAGDAFSGALALALCEGKSIGEACEFANAAAALSVTRKGAQTSMPNYDEVARFFQSLV